MAWKAIRYTNDECHSVKIQQFLVCMCVSACVCSQKLLCLFNGIIRLNNFANYSWNCPLKFLEFYLIFFLFFLLLSHCTTKQVLMATAQNKKKWLRWNYSAFEINQFRKYDKFTIDMTIFFISLQILTDVMRIKTLNLVTKNWCSNGGSKREWEKHERGRPTATEVH